jgi:hypothetical protein
MTINGFIIGVIALLFGYNFAATKWQDYQKKKLQKRRDERDYRRRY